MILPLHWQVKAILEKMQRFTAQISTQKYNDYIKLVCFDVIN
jgi:hypothetical protein